MVSSKTNKTKYLQKPVSLRKIFEPFFYYKLIIWGYYDQNKG